MKPSCAVVGAGIAGRLLALELSRRGGAVTLFDDGAALGSANCSETAAAMLSPFCERDCADAIITQLGEISLALWPEILRELGGEIFFQKNGSLVVAHHRDYDELRRFQERLEKKNERARFQIVGPQRIDDLEPALAGRFLRGLYFKDEGQIDNRTLLPALLDRLRQREVVCIFQTTVDIMPYTVVTPQATQRYDVVADCRGLGAKSAQPILRGVRGEILKIFAPSVSLNRPVRLMHPHQSIYVVPRPGNLYLLGATTIESEDRGPISVQSTMELLSAAFAVHPGFAEGRILEARTQCRPAYPENNPRLRIQPGLIELNGLYRHGYLISPALTRAAAELFFDQKTQIHLGLLLQKGT